METARPKTAYGVSANPKARVTLLLFALSVLCILCYVASANDLAPANPLGVPSTAVTDPSDATEAALSRDSGQWQTKQMRVTAYCPCPKCCGQYSDGITASGHKIREQDTFVAADSQYSFGTQMIIPGYNNSEPVAILDRGGAIRGDKLDVFFNTHQQALEWGVRYLQVKIRTE